jgi:hypothetical protein
MIVVPLLFLLVIFLLVPQITPMLDSRLNSLPMRFAAVLMVLAAFSYDKVIALGVFLVITAIYIQHHDNDILSVLGTANNMAAYSGSDSTYAKTMGKLDKGGQADESYDSSDFTSKTEDQDNEFSKGESSIDEKHALLTEPLGSKSSALFPDDSKHVSAMEHGNKDGYSE